ncbi:MAG: protein kinase [Blastochloris sp.]|nr:protein kinase [Blastochloris sp.]
MHIPNIVQVHDVRSLDGAPYIIMEYIAGDTTVGSSLRGWILHKRLSLDFAISILLQVCRGLAFAQTKVPGLVHRDLKPENILVTDDRIAKVTDFGLVASDDIEDSYLARFPDNTIQEPFHASFTRTGQILGTPPYMSPEQCQGRAPDIRSDIYALGCILYELLTGRWLLESSKPDEWLAWHIQGTPMPPSHINPDFAPFDDIVLRCLEKTPAARYPSFADLSDALLAVAPSDANRHAQIPPLPHMPSAPDTRSSLTRAKAFNMLGDHTRAMAELDTAAGSEPARHDVLVLRARILLDQGDLDAAEHLIEEALSMEPDSARATANMALLYLQQGRPAEARPILERLVARNDLEPDVKAVAWNNLGIANQEFGQSDDALACYDQAIASDPYLHAPWLNKGHILFHQSKKSDAMVCFKEAFRYTSNYEEKAKLAFGMAHREEFILDADEMFFEISLAALHRAPPGILFSVEEYGIEYFEILRSIGVVNILVSRIVRYLYSNKKSHINYQMVYDAEHYIDGRKNDLDDSHSQIMRIKCTALLNTLCVIRFLAMDEDRTSVDKIDLAMRFVRRFAPSCRTDDLIGVIESWDRERDFLSDLAGLAQALIDKSRRAAGR